VSLSKPHDLGLRLELRRIDNGPEQFRRVFGELAPTPLSVAFEATCGWSWFADLLADGGIEAHMAHPLATKATENQVSASDVFSLPQFFHFAHARLN